MQVTRAVWLVEVRVLGVDWEPWLLLTDSPVQDAPSAVRIFTMYRQRWSVEDSFKFFKTCLGWEEVQVLDWLAIRTLVALAWVAAGFLFKLGVTFDRVEVQLLAKLGGSLRCLLPRLHSLSMQLHTKDFRLRSPLSYTVGTLQASYEWMSDWREKPL